MFLSIEQYGFRIGLKTDNAIYKLTSEILNAKNNKLLVGSIICDMEKAFYIDHGIVLSKLNSCDINGKDHALFQSYLDNRNFWTTIYNDSDNSNKVSSWSKARHVVRQGSVLGPPLFLLFINDLSKIINKTSAPLIFADDSSILFVNFNLIDFNNIHIVFETLNERFKAN